MAKRVPRRASKKPEKLKCKKGSFPVEVEIGNKKVVVCGRLTAEEVKEVKKRVREVKKEVKKSGFDWTMASFGVLDVLGSILQGFGHFH